jgi:hypothetical protein
LRHRSSPANRQTVVVAEHANLRVDPLPVSSEKDVELTAIVIREAHRTGQNTSPARMVA